MQKHNDLSLVNLAPTFFVRKWVIIMFAMLQNSVSTGGYSFWIVLFGSNTIRDFLRQSSLQMLLPDSTWGIVLLPLQKAIPDCTSPPILIRQFYSHVASASSELACPEICRAAPTRLSHSKWANDLSERWNERKQYVFHKQLPPHRKTRKVSFTFLVWVEWNPKKLKPKPKNNWLLCCVIKISAFISHS